MKQIKQIQRLLTIVNDSKQIKLYLYLFLILYLYLFLFLL